MTDKTKKAHEKIPSSDLAATVEQMLKMAKGHKEIDEAEAYVSRNTLAMARIETLRHGQRVIGPSPQQVVTMMTAEASVRVVVKGAVGTYSTNYFTADSLRAAVEGALANTRIMSTDPDYRSLAKPVDRKPPTLGHDNDILGGTASDTLIDRAQAALAELRSTEKDIDIAGSVMALANEVSLANTNGIDLGITIDTLTVAALTAERMEGPNNASSGVGWSTSRTLKGLDGTIAAKDALELARLKPERLAVPEGDYSVILGPYSVADVLDNMLHSTIALSSTYYGMCWLPSRPIKVGDRELRTPSVGDRVGNEKVTIIDDPTLEHAMGSRSYDDEGLPTKKATIIEKGIYKGVLNNTYFAYLYGMEPTASGFRYGLRPGRLASSSPDTHPTNLIVKPGDMTFDEMVAESKGPTLVIPRTWYTYPTRYGGRQFSSSNRATSYIVEKGELVSVAPNAFKMSGDMSLLLNGVEGISKETKVGTTWAATSAYIVPWIKTTGFKVEKPREN